MRVLLDLRESWDSWTGMGRYALNVTRELSRVGRHDYVALLPHGIARPDAIGSMPVVRSVPAYHPLEHIDLPRLIRRERIDYLHSLSYAYPLWSPIVGSLTLFDLVPILYPDNYSWRAARYWRHVLPRTLRRAQRIVTLSCTSKISIVERFQIDVERVTVARFGVDECFSKRADDDAAVLNRLGVAEPYILTHGNARPHKNVAGLMAAFQLIRNDCGLTMVISGGPQVANAPGILHLGRIDDATLRSLYRSARAYVQPSLYEGAGLTPLEAMACDTPVIVTRAGALVELYGGATVVTDSTPTALAAAIRQVVSDESLRDKLRGAGRVLVATHRWVDATRDVEAVIADGSRGSARRPV